MRIMRSLIELLSLTMSVNNIMSPLGPSWLLHLLSLSEQKQIDNWKQMLLSGKKAHRLYLCKGVSSVINTSEVHVLV